jgi:hypothetical protein
MGMAGTIDYDPMVSRAPSAPIRRPRSVGPGAAGPYHAFGGQNPVGTRCAASVFLLGRSMALADAELPRTAESTARSVRPDAAGPYLA